MTKIKLSDYLKQEENNIICLEECVIEIDTENYDFKTDILEDDARKILWVRNLISKVTFKGVTFDLILDYPAELNILMLEKNQVKYLLYFPKNAIIFTVSMEVEDIKKQVAYLERLASGRELYKDVNHLFLRVYRAYKDVSDMDLVHLEVFVSNILRDKNDDSIPARLSSKYNPTLIPMKGIVFKQGFLQALSFENIGKSIEAGLTSEKYTSPSIIEKILTGTIVEKPKQR